MAEIDLDSHATAAAGRRLADCGAELMAARRTTGANLESMNSACPWGRDELGDLFSRGYEQAAGQTLDAWRKAAEGVADLGSRVQQATTRALETDHITSEVIDKVL